MSLDYVREKGPSACLIRLFARLETALIALDAFPSFFADANATNEEAITAAQHRAHDCDKS
jgi:hypothetical protein